MAFKPLGARIIVEDIITELDLEARGKRVGIFVITDAVNQPKPTSGKVVALGTDPMLIDAGLKIGDVVQFGKLAGSFIYLKGVQYRSLEFQELIGFDDEEETNASTGSTSTSSGNHPNPPTNRA